jgi:hypothetical protein
VGSSVRASVTGTATPTTTAERHPMASAMSATTDSVARRRCSMSSFDFSCAVSP